MTEEEMQNAILEKTAELEKIKAKGRGEDSPRPFLE